jgi:protoheme IX farnesyltransferase
MLLVIVWGVFVRASGSGDGCGVHWPTCHGSIIPQAGSETKTWVEYVHRITSAAMGLWVIALLVWAFRAFPKGSQVRVGAVFTFILTLSEGWLGRQLVVYKYVAYSEEPARLYWMCAHLVNTFCLLAAFALTAWLASGKARIQFRKQGPFVFLVLSSLVAMLVLSVTGAISALGDTLYPPENHLEVVQQALLPTATLVMKARPLHPYTAMAVAMYLSLVAGILENLRPSPNTRRFAYAVWAMLGVQMVLGLVNVGLLAPIWMQLVHLLTADILWICLLYLGASALAEGVPQVEMQMVPKAVMAGERATIKDYVALTKPRVISLLLFTTIMAMFVAAKGWPGNSFLHGLWLLVATGAGLYAAAGSSNTINMVMERDLDVRMERTASRPTITERIHPRSALWFAIGLEFFSFGILWLSSNLLAASLALAGLVVYVVIYTLLLKRRTWSNIVIGGAAGCFPALVGYAAASGTLNLMAWMLFTIVFVWTPVHFWALAILIKDDYAKAGVPMLPVVKGERYTVGQIGVYTLITVIVSFTPMFFGMDAKWVYGVAAVILNVLLVRGCIRLYQKIDRPRASSLFHYSMIYLALLFLALAIDKAVLA